jgi:hypothetical protein
MTSYPVAAPNIMVAAIVAPRVLARKNGRLSWHTESRVNSVHQLPSKLAVFLAEQFIQCNKFIKVDVREMRAIIIVRAVWFQD